MLKENMSCCFPCLGEQITEKFPQSFMWRPLLGQVDLTESGTIAVDWTQLVSCASVFQPKLDHAGVPECCYLGISRFYHFCFYVIDKYIDPGSRHSSLSSYVFKCFSSGKEP